MQRKNLILFNRKLCHQGDQKLNLAWRLTLHYRLISILVLCILLLFHVQTSVNFEILKNLSCKYYKKFYNMLLYYNYHNWQTLYILKISWTRLNLRIKMLVYAATSFVWKHSKSSNFRVIYHSDWGLKSEPARSISTL